MAEIIARVPHDRNDHRVVLGDAASAEFVPRLRLERWGGEVSFSLRRSLSGIPVAQREFSQDGERYSLEANSIGFHFYPKERGYEFEIVFKRRPSSERISFPIETAGLRFCYQLPLTDEWRVGDDHFGVRVGSVTETDVFDERGENLCHRPENVVGSYAVYHATKRGDFTALGGNNYRAGKAFHIYRPKLIDAEGREAWASLDIDEAAGELVITCPSDFLRSATYPVTLDPELGYVSEGASERTMTVEYIYSGIQGTADATGGEASKLSAFCRIQTGSDTATLKMGFYNDSGDSPSGQALVGGDDTGVTVSGTSDTWYDSNAISGTVVASTKYWPALMKSAGDGALRYNYDGSGTAFYKDTNDTALPNPFTVGPASSTDQISLYLTYAPSGTTHEAAGEVDSTTGAEGIAVRLRPTKAAVAATTVVTAAALILRAALGVAAATSGAEAAATVIAGGATHEAAATVAATTGATGSICVLRPVVGSVASTSTAAGVAVRSLPVAAAVAGSSAASGRASVLWSAAGGVSGASSATGRFTGDRRARAAVASSSTVAGVACRLLPVSGSIAATSTVTAGVTEYAMGYMWTKVGGEWLGMGSLSAGTEAGGDADGGTW
jgi:hypothetical protein